MNYSIIIYILGHIFNFSAVFMILPCVKHLQNNTLRGRLSTSFKMLAPVVEKPDTDSNNAFVKLGILPVSI